MDEAKEVELDNLQDRSNGAVPSTQRHQSDSGIVKKSSNIDASHKTSSTPHLPSDVEKRHVSVQESDERAALPRASVQMSHHRKSVEFDRRTDGPFGRPSITMARRASQQHGAMTSDEPLPVLPIVTADGDSPATRTEVVPFQPEPPPLNYDLWSRKWWIIGFWTLVVFDSVVCPVVGDIPSSFSCPVLTA